MVLSPRKTRSGAVFSMSSSTSVRGLGYSIGNNVEESVVVVEEFTRARQGNNENEVNQNVAGTRINDRIVDQSSVENEGEIMRQDTAKGCGNYDLCLVC